MGDVVLAQKLRTSGAVLIEGPKWCGKTSTGFEAAKSTVFLQDPDKRKSYEQMADTRPSLLLQGETPRLLDEWQTLPVLWDAVRFAVDQRNSMGQFILTGSATPLDDNTAQAEILHPGTGRIARMRMRPMSLWESRNSTGSVSLKGLFDGVVGDDLYAESKASIEDLAYLMCRGGWPGTLHLDRQNAIDVAFNYVDEIIQLDVHRVDGMEKNPERVRQVLRSYARNISTMASATTIMQDVKASDMSISDKTLTNYLTALRRLFVVEDVKAWQPSLRSKTAIRTSDKRHFADPSIATALLGLNPASVLDDFNLFGYLFEDLCVRDLRAYIETMRGEVLHYHDHADLEADAVLRLFDGRWALVEVKTGSKQIEEAASNLVKLAATVDTKKIGEPSFLMVLTGGEFAYRRSDGVFVVPIAILKD